ncbi:unnamed protein product [Paramecium sonneborni]|uniref:Uncharacterized protein n=1 Tax=Paramecium sonneborni TaxID=65129 RepID=A0A8S1RJU7_9CILI|nr:unnamed protein product [Paramecium sonneborni]
MENIKIVKVIVKSVQIDSHRTDILSVIKCSQIWNLIFLQYVVGYNKINIEQQVIRIALQLQLNTIQRHHLELEILIKKSLDYQMILEMPQDTQISYYQRIKNYGL